MRARGVRGGRGAGEGSVTASTRPETASSWSIWAHALSQSASRRSNLWCARWEDERKSVVGETIVEKGGGEL